MRDVVLCADAREALASLGDASVDAVVTDPPYALTQVSRGGSPRSNDPSKPHGRHRLADKGFMGQQWDNGLVAHDPAFWAEVLRVAKPGAFLVAFGGDRTVHRLAVAIEDAGWEIRGSLYWMHAQGFPKNLNVTRGVETLLGADALCACAHHSTQTTQGSPADCQGYRHCDDEQPPSAPEGDRGVLPSQDDARVRSHGDRHVDVQGGAQASTCPDGDNAHPSSGDLSLRERLPAGACQEYDSTPCDTLTNTSRAESTAGHSTASDTPHMLRSDGAGGASSPHISNGGCSHLAHCSTCGKVVVPAGLGTALKPAVEPIVLARKPLVAPTVASNVLAHGTGALQIDACRVPTAEDLNGGAYSAGLGENTFFRHLDRGRAGTYTQPTGRWPSNLVLSHVGGPDGCRPTGVRRVRGSNVPGPRGQAGQRENAWGWRAAPVHAYNDADGTEQVQSWQCVDGGTITVPSYAGSFGALSPLGEPAFLLDQLGSLIQAVRAYSTTCSSLLPDAVACYHSGHTQSADSWDGPSGAIACALGLSKLLGSLADCPSCRHFCDGLAHQVLATCQEDVPSLVDALARAHQALCARARSRECQSEVLHSSDDGARLSSMRLDNPLSRTVSGHAPSSSPAPAFHTEDTPHGEPPRSALRDSTDVSSISVADTHRTCSDSAHISAAVRLLSLLSADLAWRFLLPAHIIQRTEIDINLPICPVKALDEQAGECPSKMGGSSPKSGFWGQAGRCEGLRRDDTGGPSRFFPTFASEPEDAVPFLYCAKASRRERDAGVHDVDPQRSAYRPNDPDENTIRTRLHGSRSARNSHPTVKPVGLMQWLCRLVCPADGLVLDPFAGSGSTGVACVREGLHYLLIEQDVSYVEIARRRIAHEQQRQIGPLFAGVAAAGHD